MLKRVYGWLLAAMPIMFGLLAAASDKWGG